MNSIAGTFQPFPFISFYLFIYFIYLFKILVFNLYSAICACKQNYYVFLQKKLLLTIFLIFSWYFAVVIVVSDCWRLLTTNRWTWQRVVSKLSTMAVICQLTTFILLAFVANAQGVTVSRLSFPSVSLLAFCSVKPGFHYRIDGPS